ncbi:SNF7 family protein [Heterostelium album PN500]|uniref:SNF7 family protein n=1 Tax=Heterostelium pallidum (strain ATCC 26659 / Pp 5 / PN500) TaxID=670386 RepID=D3AYE1_HETP5|nr:SNF7 family protein [Heterostelium album PN500]EFA85968.1 SNF7 family protein [Heterostelium album PN500]|eukprot:XP_020438074.1 SNF7 family protein [Heterostelium album PN500]
MNNIFGGGKPDPKKQLKESKRDLNKSQRELDRQIFQLDQQEKATIIQVKALAKKGQEANARTLAKEIVRIREQKDKLRAMKTTMMGVSTKTTTMATNQSMMKAMGTATKAMTIANNQYNVAAVQKTMMEYQKQVHHAEVSDEMLQDMFEDDEVDEEADSVLTKIVDEISLDNYSKMPGVSRDYLSTEREPVNKVTDADIDALLQGLKI